ncbi:MAG TPA: hypothetical protein VMU89_15325 [Thermomicrobiaceae bacterium]|nr:hypothetical protein [Thermomicrobiaceae bacterium]
MVPATLHDYFIASAGASAALIGLLFVAVSIAPERVFGSAASGDRTYRASSAFFVLGNGLFVSLGGLLPQLNVGSVLVAAGTVGLVNTIMLVVDLWQRGRRELGRGLLLATGSFAIFGGEVWTGAGLLRHPDATAAVYVVTYLVLGGYVIGLARAWELVGGRDYSLLMTVLLPTVLHRGRISPPADSVNDGGQPRPQSRARRQSHPSRSGSGRSRRG